MSKEKPEAAFFEQQETALVESFKQLGATIEADYLRIEGSYIVSFPFEGGATNIRIGLKDSSGADLVIANMTTLPDEKMGEGHGSKALHKLLSWAEEKHLTNVRAVQVGEEAEGFYEKNGFVKDKGTNKTNDFVLQRQDQS